MSFVNDVMAGLGDVKGLVFFEDRYTSSNPKASSRRRKKVKKRSEWNVFLLFFVVASTVWILDQIFVNNVSEAISSIANSELDSHSINHQFDQDQIESAQIDQAQNLIQQGQTESAHKILRQILVSNDNHLQARLLLASSLIEQDQIRDAIKLYAQGFKITPKEQYIAIPLAQLLDGEGKIDLAIRVLQKAAPSRNSDPEYHSTIAALQQKIGHHKKAINTYQYILKVRPDNQEWWLGLGISFLAETNNREALSAFEKSLRDETISPMLSLFAQQRVKELKQRVTNPL